MVLVFDDSPPHFALLWRWAGVAVDQRPHVSAQRGLPGTANPQTFEVWGSSPELSEAKDVPRGTGVEVRKPTLVWLEG